VSGASDRKHELLADRALAGLTEAEARELMELGGADDESFELAAAAAALAELERAGELRPLPAALKEKVLHGARPSTSGRDAPLRSGRAEPPLSDVPNPGRAHRPRWDRGRSLAWIVAAAAMVLAVFGWLRPFGPGAPPEPAQARAELLEKAPDVRTIPWQATPDPAAKGAEGDVVWSASRQQGYMRIRGLAANDPKAVQYQLWIFDGTRDQRYPVDGGVFDVTGGEVVVPIHAKIGVRDAKLFAVTVEPPGGVVVSDRERIVLMATL